MKKQKLSKKRKIKFSIISLIIITSLLIAYSFGFIPVCLSIKQPIGNIEQIQIDQYFEKYPELSDIPNLDKILYEVIGTDEPFDLVLNEYKDQLENDGYTLKFEGTGYITEKNFVYIGYLKGITAIGIIISNEGYEESNHATSVVYMTGNAFDFIPILEWYQENYDPGAFF